MITLAGLSLFLIGAASPVGLVSMRGGSLKPIMLSSSQNYQVLRGSNVFLECKVSNLGSAVVLWRKGDRILAAGKHLVRKDGKVTVTEENELELHDVVEEDAGRYMCEVDGGLGGKTREVTHSVQILVAPVITKWDLSREATAGDDVVISCEATGNPTPTISWRKHQDGRVLIPDSSGQKLVLRNVGRRESGLYICRADNSVSTGVEKVTRITVHYAPEMSMEEAWYPRPKLPPKGLYAGGGEFVHGTFEVRLVCAVQAHPLAQVVWFYNKTTRLSTSDRLSLEERKEGGQTLTLHKLSYNDFGLYTCRASNILGREERSVEISGKPRPPTFSRDQPEILNSVDQVNLTWSTDSLAPVTQYTLHYRKSQAGATPEEISSAESSWSRAVLPVLEPNPALTSGASYTLMDLEKESVYDVKVQAVNRFGMSRFSRVFNFYVKTAVEPVEPEVGSPRFLQTDLVEQPPKGVHHQGQQLASTSAPTTSLSTFLVFLLIIFSTCR